MSAMTAMDLVGRIARRSGYILAEHTRRLPAEPEPRAAHFEATLAWLLRAHDSTPDGGVAAGYQPARRKWFSSYPETTGYIIPTLLRIARHLEAGGRSADAADLRARARRMGEWEIEVQMPEGCVQADYLGTEPRPAVFNTGQVLFGWCALHDHDRDPGWLEPAARAVRWLAAMQEPNGSWRRGQSPKAPAQPHTYDVRVAWALLEYHRITADAQALLAARRAADWTRNQQEPDGWYAATALGAAPPTTHPIGYVLEGLLACHLRLGEVTFLESVRRAADALLTRLTPDGRLPGAFDRGWLPRARSTCLTGNAQIAIVWGWLYALGGEARYLDGLRRANHFIARTQLLHDPDPGIRGGVKGSHPNTQGYSPFFYPNWAAKFFLDSMMLEQALTGGAAEVRPHLPWCG
jgi:hypothetical protein